MSQRLNEEVYEGTRARAYRGPEVEVPFRSRAAGKMAILRRGGWLMRKEVRIQVILSGHCRAL